MMAMTTSSSIRVNALEAFLVEETLDLEADIFFCKGLARVASFFSIVQQIHTPLRAPEQDLSRKSYQQNGHVWMSI